jgi:hypothetical protein
MPRRDKIVIGLAMAAAAAVAGVLLFLMSRSGDRSENKLRLPLISEAPSSRGASRPSTTSSRARPLPFKSAIAETGRAEVVVTNETGSAVVGAKVFKFEQGTRFARLDKGSILQVTDQLGVADFEPPTEGSQRLAVAADDYAVAGVPALKPGDCVRVVLSGGAAEDFAFEDREGRPVSGVRLCMSQVSISAGELPSVEADGSTAAPLPDLHHTIYSATANDNGRVRLTGLVPGRYLCDMFRRGMFPDMTIPSLIVEVPSGILHHVRLMEVYAAVMRPVSDAVDDYVVPDIPHPYMTRGSLSWSMTIRNDLIAKWPGCVVVTHVPAATVSGPIECSVTTYLASGKCAKLRGELRPAADISAPTEVVLSAGDYISGGIGALLITLTDHEGNEQLDVPFVLSSGWGQAQFKVMSGRLKNLPAGHYSVASVRAIKGLQGQLGAIDIIEGRSQTVACHDVEMPVKCSLTVRTRDGANLGTIGINITSVDAPDVNYGGASPLIFYLPAGAKGKAHVYAFGLADQDQEFVVPQRSASGAADFALSVVME